MVRASITVLSDLSLNKTSNDLIETHNNLSVY